TLQKVPYLLVVGDKEVENGQVALRSREGVDLGVMTIDAVCDTLAQEISSKGINSINKQED
ncbi:MAG: His/Gly/Thr/Pro-type tRNA ligase C-terminal domain-containing protein, partial [Legionella sp.]